MTRLLLFLETDLGQLVLGETIIALTLIGLIIGYGAA